MSINTKQEAQKPSRIDCKIPSRASHNDKQEEAEGGPEPSETKDSSRHRGWEVGVDKVPADIPLGDST